MSAELFRVYGSDELGGDGYPRAWHRIELPESYIEFLTGEQTIGLKDIVRAQAEHRCERCGHRYVVGAVATWVEVDDQNVLVSRCDERCTHGGPWYQENPGGATYALWRVLTVHHLNGNKADCRWWNLAALCQRCHLTIQGRVTMERAFMFEHTDWMKPHAAGFYADKYLGEQLTREQAAARQDELLSLERLA